MRKIILTLFCSLFIITLSYAPLALQYFSVAHADDNVDFQRQSVGGLPPGSVEATPPGSVGGAPTNNLGLALENPLKYDSICGLLSAIITLITEIGAVIAVILFIWTGFKFVTARGNPAEITKAKQAFFTTIIGTAILLGASVIAQVIIKTVFTITMKGQPQICNI